MQKVASLELVDSPGKGAGPSINSSLLSKGRPMNHKATQVGEFRQETRVENDDGNRSQRDGNTEKASFSQCNSNLST